MPLFGAHMSIAGGFHTAVDAAHGFAMETVQIFTSSPSQWCVGAVSGRAEASRGWAGKPLVEEDVRRFKERVRECGIRSPIAHDSYLINLASPDEALRGRSIEAFAHEMDRAEALGLSYLVMHPGTPTDGDEKAGLKRIAEALDEVLRRCKGYGAMTLLETTAGQGKTLGHRFEHLAAIRAKVKASERIGICLDTCHVFAAGYPLAPKVDYEATFQQFDDIVGLEHLKAFHVNDSVKPFGSRVDRHAHLGKGCLGLEPFRLLVNDARFAELPMVLETPKEDDMDAVNIATLRGLRAGG